MPRRDLTAFLEDDSLQYPGVPSKTHPDGKDYRVSSPDAATGLWLASLGTAGMVAAEGGELDPEVPGLKMDDGQERNLYQRVLGDTYDEMVADGVSWTMLRHIAQDAFLYWAINPAFADAALAGLGEAVARDNRAARRAKAKRSGSTTKRTAAKTAGSKSSRASTPTQALTG